MENSKLATHTSAVLLLPVYHFCISFFLSSQESVSRDPSKMGDKNAISTSGSDRKRLKMIESVYNCTVCLGLPICNIYQCLEGHLICMDCHNKMPTPVNCPTCRTPFPLPPIRSRLAEQVIILTIYGNEV